MRCMWREDGRLCEVVAPPEGDADTRVERLIFGLLFFFVALVFSKTIDAEFTLPKLLAFRAILPAIALLWGVRLKRDEITPVPRGVLITASAVGLWWAIATAFAQLPFVALHGAYGRYDGALTYWTYLFVFLVLASSRGSIRDVEALVRLLIASLIPVAACAIAQSLGWIGSGYSGDAQLARFPVLQMRPTSTIGHPVPLAAALGLVLPFAFTSLINERHALTKWIWGAVLALLAVAAMTTLSRGPWMGIGVGLAIVAAAAAREGRIGGRAVGGGVVAMAAVAVIFVIASPAQAGRVEERVMSLMRLEHDASGMNRLVFFRAAIGMIRDHPITGVGLENFSALYPRYRSVESASMPTDVVPTMVHNGYLQTAATTGLPGLVFYLSLVGTVMNRLWRTYRAASGRRRSFAAACAGAIGGYLVQDLSGWPEVSLSLFFWVVLGIAVRVSIDPAAVRRPVGVRLRWVGYGVAGFAVACTSVLALDTAREFAADRLVHQARTLNLRRDWATIDVTLTRALRWAGANPHFRDAAGVLYLERLVASGDANSYVRGAALLDDAHQLNPFDPYVMIHRLDLERVALRSGIVRVASPTVENEVHLLTEMDGNNSTVHASIAAFRLAQGRPADARVALEQAKALRPDLGRFIVLERDIHTACRGHNKCRGRTE